MQLSSEYQDLINFFADRDLPTGPQHVNEYSIFLNLQAAVASQINRLHSEVEATQKSAAALLIEVRSWLIKRDTTN